MTIRRAALVLALVVAVAGCGGTSGETGLAARPMIATGAQPDTAIPLPDTTVPPETTAAPTVPPATPPATETDDASGPGVVVTPSGVVVPVVSEVDGGWRVRTPCGDTRTITAGTHVRHVDIVLDPGHGGNERGAISPGGLAEAGVNLEISRRAQAVLEAEGISVMLTRTADYDVGLTPRALMATALTPQAFVSIHNNADPDGPRPTPGTETYYQMASADSRRLAGLVQEEVVRALSGYRVAWVGDTDAGAKIRPGANGDYYAVLRQPGEVTSVLAELAFMSNPPEADLISRPEVQAVAGAAVARAVLRYLRTDDPGSGFTEAYPRGPNAPGPPGPPAPACVDPQF